MPTPSNQIAPRLGLALGILTCSLFPLVVRGQATAAQGSIRDVVLHPPMEALFTCAEHSESGYELGDAYGSDCFVVGIERGSAEPWAKLYRADGSENEHWYSWGEPVLAPFTGMVESVYINPITNKPGESGTGTASMIVFLRPDSLRVRYAHVMDVGVSKGDSVVAGQPVAKVGSNGISPAPHLHVGAWRGEEPLQIRFDLRTMDRLRKRSRGR